MQSTTQKHRLSRAAVAGLATLGLSASFLGLTLATAPGAQAAGVITSVVINEVESNPQLGDTIPGNDWIELYNTDLVNSVSLSGASLSDSDPSHSTALSGSIPAGGYVTVKVDDSMLVGDFGLGGADSARLLSGSTLIDTYSWSAHAGTTYGRCANGSGPMVTTVAPTPGGANSCSGGGAQPTPGPLKGVYINEVETKGDTVHGNWIELYNSTGNGINLAGAILADNNNGHTYQIPASTIIPADGYYTAIVQDVMDAGPFGLGDVDQARLFEPGTTDLAAATPVDSYGWNTHSLTSYGRDWDDTELGQWNAPVGKWKQTCGNTFEDFNDFECSAPEDNLDNVVINEVESDPEASPAKAGDWVELYNNSATESVTIAGAVISDSDPTHAFQIPDDANGVLAPHSYVAFRVDVSAVDGNFGLGGGDSVQLFRAGSDMADPLLPGLVDSYTWSSHAAQTYGRCADGVGSFVNTIAPTPGAANNCPTP